MRTWKHMAAPLWAVVAAMAVAASCGKPAPDPDPAPVGGPTGWMELPAMPQTDGLRQFTHRMTVSGRSMRNFSYCWDYDALVSHWVAYPLNAALIGSGSRSNEWGLDPLLSEAEQPVLYSAYKGGWGYARGHQIPSADRLSRAANVQTFYGTNMTPQDYDFNGGLWASLE